MDVGGVAAAQQLLVGPEIHGFHTWQDLDVVKMVGEAERRWLRPNEIHAILSNPCYFTIHVKPVTLPESGTMILFDRKKLRNFRKDGHSWRRKKDGRTVREAHEHLKIGNEERIHVYYAHGQDNPTFARRVYWLLDKKLDNIVLVHYRETQESQNSPAAPVTSFSSTISDPSAPWLQSEEFDSGTNQTFSARPKVLTGPDDNLTVKNHQLRLREINTLDWDQLVTDDPSTQVPERSSYLGHQNIADPGYVSKGQVPTGSTCSGSLDGRDATMEVQENSDSLRDEFSNLVTGNFMDFLQTDGLQSHTSFGNWMNYVTIDPPNLADGATAEPLLSSLMGNQPSSVPDLVFNITDVGPAWAFSTQQTKVIVTGFFTEGNREHSKANLFCICGDYSVPAEVVQDGVYRCLISPHSAGLVNLCMSFDGHKPISQAVNFEYRPAPLLQDHVPSTEGEPKWEELLQLQIRLGFLLFSTSKCLDITACNISPTVQKDAKEFSLRSASILKDWAYFLSSVGGNKLSSLQAKDCIFELMLKNRLKDWILERIITGCETFEYDHHGQGVIHLCAILGYTWAVQLYSWSGLSLDYRDKFGWTALHWAAHCGREQMVAKLLSAGAKPNLVTDPTSHNPGGCTAADLASLKGYEGISAYLGEKSLVQHFQDMSSAGNASGSIQTTPNTTSNTEVNPNQEGVYVAAYRTAADAAARIQAALRENSFKVRSQQVKLSNTEEEARNIVAAMKIQKAFRNYGSKKKMGAAVQIQSWFHSWKMRRKFLKMRSQAIKIQTAFRGLRLRRQYLQLVRSVGVIEKAILRWRWRRKGLRGFSVKEEVDGRQDNDGEEEDFIKIGRKQTEERIERSVVKVQAMFRSKKAQEEYKRMKSAHEQAKLEYEEEHDQ